MTQRCANCGTTEMPADTIVIDFRAELLCSRCVESFDWTDWQFDPLANVYQRA